MSFVPLPGKHVCAHQTRETATNDATHSHNVRFAPRKRPGKGRPASNTRPWITLLHNPRRIRIGGIRRRRPLISACILPDNRTTRTLKILIPTRETWIPKPPASYRVMPRGPQPTDVRGAQQPWLPMSTHGIKTEGGQLARAGPPTHTERERDEQNTRILSRTGWPTGCRFHSSHSFH